MLSSLFPVIRGNIDDFNDLISEAAINMYNEQHPDEPLLDVLLEDIGYEMVRVENEGLVLSVSGEVVND